MSLDFGSTKLGDFSQGWKHPEAKGSTPLKRVCCFLSVYPVLVGLTGQQNENRHFGGVPKKRQIPEVGMGQPYVVTTTHFYVVGFIIARATHFGTYF